MSAAMNTGIVGLGAMGGAMAEVLLAGGFAVAGYDPATQAQERLRKAGGDAVKNPRALNNCDALIVMTVNADQAEETLFAKDDSPVAPGMLVMLCFTMPPSRAVDIARRLEGAGCDALDAPVTGGEAGARNGNLVFMLGGSKRAVSRSEPLTAALGKRALHFGEAGAGSTAKMINQLVAGCNLAVVAEAFALAEKTGTPKQTIYEMLRAGAGQSWMLEDRGPRMLNQQFTPAASAVDIFVKDLNIVLGGGEQAGMPLPMSKAALARFAAASAAGMGREDDSALVKFCANAKE